MFASIREGITSLLEELTCGHYTQENTMATIETEVAAQHHTFVMGLGKGNVKDIMRRRGCTIMFPEPNASIMGLAQPAASSLPYKRSTVTIRAPNFTCAFESWQELIGHLPLMLIFDLPETQEDCDANLVAHLMESLKVSILVKPKQKQNNKSVTVRAAEKDSRTLFEVRRQILNLDSSEVPYCCEPHFLKNQDNKTTFGNHDTPFTSRGSFFGNEGVRNTSTSSSGMFFDLERPTSLSRPQSYSSIRSLWSSEAIESRGRSMFEPPTSVANFQSSTVQHIKLEDGFSSGPTSVSGFSTPTLEDDDGRKRSLSDEGIGRCSMSSVNDSKRLDDLFATDLDSTSDLRLKAFRRIHSSKCFDAPLSTLASMDGQFLSRTLPSSVRNLRSVQSANSLFDMGHQSHSMSMHRTESENWGENMLGMNEKNVFSQTQFVYPPSLPKPSDVFRPCNVRIDQTDLPHVLSHFGFSRFLDNFQHDSLRQFLCMDREDLRRRGIPYDTREQMVALIQSLESFFFEDGHHLNKKPPINSNHHSSNPNGFCFPRQIMTGPVVSTSTSSMYSEETCLTPTASNSPGQAPMEPESLAHLSVSDDVFSLNSIGFEAAPGAERQRF